MFLSSSKDVPISFPKCSPRCSQRVPQILKLFPQYVPNKCRFALSTCHKTKGFWDLRICFFSVGANHQTSSSCAQRQARDSALETRRDETRRDERWPEEELEICWEYYQWLLRLLFTNSHQRRWAGEVWLHYVLPHSASSHQHRVSRPCKWLLFCLQPFAIGSIISVSTGKNCLLLLFKGKSCCCFPFFFFFSFLFSGSRFASRALINK